MANHPNRSKTRLRIEEPVHLDECDRMTLSHYAKCMFLIGWERGIIGNPGPQKASLVMSQLFAGGWDGKMLHQVKFRQVYGAGYDMAQSLARSHAMEVE